MTQDQGRWALAWLFIIAWCEVAETIARYLGA